MTKRRSRTPPPGQATLFAETLPIPRRKRAAWRTERGLARNSDPATSKVAAHSVKTAALELKVCETLARYPGGLTSLQTAEVMGVHVWSISPRFRPLVKKGLIYDSGETLEGESGRDSIVWKLGPKPEVKQVNA